MYDSVSLLFICKNLDFPPNVWRGHTRSPGMAYDTPTLGEFVGLVLCRTRDLRRRRSTLEHVSRFVANETKSRVSVSEPCESVRGLR